MFFRNSHWEQKKIFFFLLFYSAFYFYFSCLTVLIIVGDHIFYSFSSFKFLTAFWRPQIRSVWINVLCAHERNCVHLLFGGVFYTCPLGQSGWVTVLFKPSVHLLIFCLLVLLITERGVLKPPNITVDFSSSHFSSGFVSCIFKLCCWGTDI